MNIEILNDKGEWVVKPPVKGDKFRMVKDGHVYLESYYSPLEEEGSQDAATN